MLRERASEAVVCAVQITSDALNFFCRRGPSRAAVLDRVSYIGNVILFLLSSKGFVNSMMDDQ
jgi:hypothetical protein